VDHQQRLVLRDEVPRAVELPGKLHPFAHSKTSTLHGFQSVLSQRDCGKRLAKMDRV
jgi:hypothetical protein